MHSDARALALTTCACGNGPADLFADLFVGPIAIRMPWCPLPRTTGGAVCGIRRTDLQIDLRGHSHMRKSRERGPVRQSACASVDAMMTPCCPQTPLLPAASPGRRLTTGPTGPPPPARTLFPPPARIGRTRSTGSPRACSSPYSHVLVSTPANHGRRSLRRTRTAL